MGYREDTIGARPIGFIIAGLLLLIFGLVLLATDALLVWVALTLDMTALRDSLGGVIGLFVLQIGGMFLFLLVPVGLLASAVISFTLAIRSVRAVDPSEPLVVVAHKVTQRSAYNEQFPVTRTSWSNFWVDLNSTMSPQMGWRLYVGLYALWVIPTTIYCRPILGDAVRPLIVAEVAIAAALIVWHVRASGRLLVKTKYPSMPARSHGAN